MNVEPLWALQPHQHCERVLIPSHRFSHDIPPVRKGENGVQLKTYMRQNPSWEANSRSATPDTPFTRVSRNSNNTADFTAAYQNILRLTQQVTTKRRYTPGYTASHSRRTNIVCFHGRPRQATGVLQPAGLLYRPLWMFQLWPPDAPAHTDAFRTLATEVGTYGRE
jgi:hypothetical protein